MIKIIFSLFVFTLPLFAQNPLSGELIFPLQPQHVHSSSIVELSNGDQLVCWFQVAGNALQTMLW